MNISISYAAAFLLCLLGAVGVFFRIAETAEPTQRETSSVCVGVVRPDGFFGLIISPHDEILDNAADHLLLPNDCAERALDHRIKTGSLLYFNRQADGRCVLSRIGALTGSGRLLCGLRLNINKEDAQGLMLLPGIGPAKASAIVESRNKEGPFRSMDDLTRVFGIGEKTAFKLRSWIEL